MHMVKFPFGFGVLEHDIGFKHKQSVSPHTYFVFFCMYSGLKNPSFSHHAYHSDST